MISIVIPVLNEEATLARTVRQFEKLSLPHEIIVADGGSSDRTLAIAGELGATIANFPPEKHQTIAANRNNGARLARGDYLAFVDADVEIPQVDTFFRRALGDFEANDKLAGLTAGIYVRPDLATFMDKVVFGVMTFNLIVLNNILHLGIAQGKFILVRKEAFAAIGGFREDLAAAEDQDLFTRLARKGRTMIDPGLKVYHSGRRAHALGWPRLLFIWWRDGFSLIFRGNIVSKDWKKAKPDNNKAP